MRFVVIKLKDETFAIVGRQGWSSSDEIAEVDKNLSDIDYYNITDNGSGKYIVEFSQEKFDAKNALIEQQEQEILLEEQVRKELAEKKEEIKESSKLQFKSFNNMTRAQKDELLLNLARIVLAEKLDLTDLGIERGVK